MTYEQAIQEWTDPERMDAWYAAQTRPSKLRVILNFVSDMVKILVGGDL